MDIVHPEMSVQRLAIAAAALFFAAPALAEESVISGVSQDVVEITSNYTGTALTVYGAIEQPHEPDIGDIVVVVRGPDTLMTVRRKDRIAGVWINRARARLKLPSYYFVGSARPLDRIAARDTLERYDIGLDNLRPDTVVSDGDARPFLAALIGAQARSGLYVENPQAVEMQGATLFRVRVPVPASVPRGFYTVQVYLFREGTVISAQSTPLYVDQTGLERRIHDFSRQRPLAYGLATVVLAIGLGWLSTLLFRRSV